MKIAIPLAGGQLSMHFGHCERLALVDVDPDTKEIAQWAEIDAPMHEPGVLPRYLAEQGATVIIAGGMGQRAQSLFGAQGIEVVVGVTGTSPQELVSSYLQGTLATGGNFCDH